MNIVKISAEGSELSRLIQVRPGDLVAADRGTKDVPAVGKVTEAGHAWRDDRPGYRHTVSVEWFTLLRAHVARPAGVMGAKVSCFRAEPRSPTSPRSADRRLRRSCSAPIPARTRTWASGLAMLPGTLERLETGRSLGHGPDVGPDQVGASST